MSIYYWRRLRPLSSFLFTAVFPHWGCDCRISKSCVCVQAMQERTRIIPIDITLSIVYKLNRRNHYGLSMMLAGSVIFFLSSVAVSFPSPCPPSYKLPLDYTTFLSQNEIFIKSLGLHWLTFFKSSWTGVLA